MERPEANPWLIHLIYKLLHAEEGALELLDGDPFEGEGAPRFIRTELYRYEYPPPEELARPHWWRRRRLGRFLPTFSKEHGGMNAAVRAAGWPELGR